MDATHLLPEGLRNVRTDEGTHTTQVYRALTNVFFMEWGGELLPVAPDQITPRPETFLTPLLPSFPQYFCLLYVLEAAGLTEYSVLDQRLNKGERTMCKVVNTSFVLQATGGPGKAQALAQQARVLWQKQELMRGRWVADADLKKAFRILIFPTRRSGHAAFWCVLPDV